MSQPGVIWAKDHRWSKPLIAYPGTERQDKIDNHLYFKNLMCNVDGERYVFVDMLNCWCNLAARVTMMRMCGLMGIKNATVNYPDATNGYNEFLIKRCDSIEVQDVPVSVCIGTDRYEVSLHENRKGMDFVESRQLIPRREGIVSVPDVVYRACVMPIRSTIYPVSYVFPGKCELLGYMAQLFSDTRDLVTVLWHVGNCVVDPVVNPKSLMLYGPGGSGKSTVLRIIDNTLGSCCGVLLDGCLTSPVPGMPLSVASVIASHRMAVAYDVGLDRYPLNMSLFKNISGSDYVRVGEHTCKTNCSLTIGTNGFVDIRKQPDYTSDAIMRRLLAVYMDVSALDIPHVRQPSGADDYIDLACAAIYTRLTYEHPPVSPMNVLATICSSVYATAQRYIEETEDYIDIYDAYEVLCIIATLTRQPVGVIAYKARLVSRSAVYQYQDKTFIRGLRPITP